MKKEQDIKQKKTGELYSILQLLSSITQSVRAAVPPVLSADSRAFAVPSVVYNLNNCTVHNIGSFT